MTIVRQVQAHALLDRVDRVEAASYLGLGVPDLFFHPSGNGGARDTKRACNPPEAAALVERFHDFTASFLRIAVLCRVLATASATRMTEVALLPIRPGAIPNELVAATVDTGEGDC